MKFIKKRGVLLTLMVLIASAVGVLAQVADSTSIPGVPNIPDWADLYANYGTYFATALGVAGIAMFLGELVVRVLKVGVKWAKVTVVWVMAIAVSFVGNYVLNVGYLADATIWETAIWGAFSGLVANGIWSSNIAFLKTIVEFLVGLIKAKQPTA